MKKFVLVSLGLLAAVGLFVYGCAMTTDTTTYASATLTHMWGFDFSTGTTPESWEDSDGDIIGWAPSPGLRRDSTTEVWFRTVLSESSTTETFIKDYGAVGLNTILNAPDSWDGGPDITLEALALSHSYVVKCLDGYAKFYVTSINAPSWEVDVQYLYTSGTTFAH